MTSKRTIELFEIYGADPSRWPEEERTLFFTHGDDPAVRQARAAALALDHALDRQRIAPAGRDLYEAMLAVPHAIPAVRRGSDASLLEFATHRLKKAWTAAMRISTMRPALPHATALVAASVMGFVFGVSDFFPDSGLGVTYDVSSLLFGGSGMEVFDL